ncbi:MAG: hypothetical protein A2138_13900 [Deltaproteobacteria bacterium RBG_16_71_12]|nr:MAG: hypothetical protein A2138_13900 [Deltaproteobacteria bacterium RBG_16_71_12]
MMHDLLNEPLLAWRDAGGTVAKTTLPGLLARLGDGSCADFPRTRPHQHHPWAMFLTQLAVHALKRGGATDPRQSEAWWRDQLLALSGGDGAAWHLVVEDLNKPAFLQPPVPEGALVKKAKAGKSGVPWEAIEHPDELDILVTSKVHDVKESVIAPSDIEAWIYALVALQTIQGYPGRGYNGVARMNGGYGNRPRIGISPGIDPARRFVRDVAVMIEEWPKLTKGRGFVDAGAGVVWILPWDGAGSLALKDLAPHFIVVCQRVRLERAAGGLAARRTTSETRRCAPEVDKGDVGDAWIPVNSEEASAFTAGPSGFSYDKLAALLFHDGYRAAPAQNPRPGDAEVMWLVASALARGQGKTAGLHERRLRLLEPVRRRLAKPETRDAMAGRAKERVARAEHLRSKVLYPALCQLARGDEVPKDIFDDRVDELFFKELFAAAEIGDAPAKTAWDVTLLELAERELARAIETWPLPDARHYRAIAAATGMFAGCARKQAPDAWAVLHPRSDEEASQPTGDPA